MILIPQYIIKLLKDGINSGIFSFQNVLVFLTGCTLLAFVLIWGEGEMINFYPHLILTKYSLATEVT